MLNHLELCSVVVNTGVVMEMRHDQDDGGKYNQIISILASESMNYIVTKRQHRNNNQELSDHLREQWVAEYSDNCASERHTHYSV